MRELTERGEKWFLVFLLVIFIVFGFWGDQYFANIRQENIVKNYYARMEDMELKQRQAQERENDLIWQQARFMAIVNRTVFKGGLDLKELEKYQ